MSDIVERLDAWRSVGVPIAREAIDCIEVTRARLAAANAEIEAAYARGYADATKSIAAVQVREHG